MPIPRCFEVQKGFLGVCSKSVSGCVVLEAFSSRARFICTTVVQVGVAQFYVFRFHISLNHSLGPAPIPLKPKTSEMNRCMYYTQTHV